MASSFLFDTMMNNINILQYNIRGIVSKDTQNYKCPQLYNLLKSKHIDVVLLQEWCATAREDVAHNGTNSDPGDQLSDSTLPSGFFPDYHIHF